MKDENQPFTPTEGELNQAQLAALIKASKLVNSTLDHDQALQRLIDLAADHERLSFLYRISDLMTTKVRLRDVLLTVMEGAAKVLKAEASSILLWDQRRRRLVFVTATGEKRRELMEVEAPLEGSIAGWVIQNEQAVIINDVPGDPRFFARADEQTGFVTRALVCAPMKVRGKLIGVIEALNKQGGEPFVEADLQLAQAVADYTALAIENARRYESALRVGEYYERRVSTGFPDPLTLLRG